MSTIDIGDRDSDIAQWEVVKPDGEIEYVFNLQRFCEEHGLNVGQAYSCKNQLGFTFNRLTKIKKTAWTVTHPTGRTEIVTNVNGFCRIHGLSPRLVFRDGRSKGFLFKRSPMPEKNLKPKWRVEFPYPSEKVLELESITEFCRENGINYGNAVKHGHSHGYTFFRLGKNDKTLDKFLEKRKNNSAMVERMNANIDRLKEMMKSDQNANWGVIHPNGHIELIEVLRQFAINHKLHATTIRRDLKTKGYIFVSKDELK